MKKNLLCLLIIFAMTHIGVVVDALAETVWHDASELKIDGKGWTQDIGIYRRLPDRCKGSVPNAVWNLSGETAGLNIKFNTNSQWIALRWTLTKGNLSMPHMPATGVSGIDLYKKNDKGQWVFTENARPRAKSNTYSIDTGDTSGEMRQYKIYLPLYNGVESLEIGVTEGKIFEQPPANKEKSIVYYGTSITQGACASRPGMAFTAILERRMNREIINLGFSGAGKMEPAMADLIAKLDAEIFVIDCLWNLTKEKPDELEKRVLNLARTLRKSHSDIPIVFVGQSHFTGPHPTAVTLIQQTAVKKLLSEGFENIHLVDGADLVGGDGEGTVDKCHPNDLGMLRHAQVLEPILRNLLKENVKE